MLPHHENFKHQVKERILRASSRKNNWLDDIDQKSEWLWIFQETYWQLEDKEAMPSIFWKKINVQPQILYPVKPTIKYEERM